MDEPTISAPRQRHDGTARLEALTTTYRVFAICVGGYALVNGLAALAGMALAAAGLRVADAMLLVTGLGFLLYVAIVMWGFAAGASAHRPEKILVAAVTSMVAAALLTPAFLSRFLPSVG